MSAAPEKLIVISGPSGVGKGTICKKLLETCNHLKLQWCVSATTRAMRDGEIDGEHYYFLTPDIFKQNVDADAFAEWAEYAGNAYGTLKSEIERVNASGHIPFIEIDVQGAQQLKASFPSALLVFIRPPSEAILHERLKTRGTNSDDDIQRRLSIAQQELRLTERFDKTVINDNLENAIQEVQSLMSTYLELSS